MNIDLNCDMGEGAGYDEVIMPFITSANIACGYHAGGEAMIRHTIALAQKYKVLIGAHPSFRDKENFGRKEMHLSPDQLYAILIQQLVKIDLVAKEKNLSLHHVKPHGALYNMAAKDSVMAMTIVQAVKDFNEELVLYGLSVSCLIAEAKKAGLATKSEVFADRTYGDDGALTPRSQANALIEDEGKSMDQVMQMVQEHSVTTTSGKIIPIVAETICVHGDGKNAARFARKLHELLFADAMKPQ
jgi:UPF0271 protein